MQNIIKTKPVKHKMCLMGNGTKNHRVTNMTKQKPQLQTGVTYTKRRRRPLIMKINRETWFMRI
jgi:hypothetical protein